MNCDNVIIQLDEYLDGELPDFDRQQVEAHLAGCALCAEACESLEREQAMYAGYARPVEAGDAMWAAIRSRIDSGSESNVVRGKFGAHRFIVPLVAAACLVVAIGIGFRAWQSNPIETKVASNLEPTARESGAPAPTSNPPVVAPENVRSVDVPPTVASVASKNNVRPIRKPATTAPDVLPLPVANAEKQYIAAIAVLRTEIDRTAGSDPTAIESTRKPLNDLDANIRTARRAVEQNPDDPIAVNSMLSAYDEKVETMQRLVALQARNDR